jgi:acetoacetate decarboxylase
MGPARLHLVPHVNAPVADLLVKKIVGGLHFLADVSLPYGRVLYDYKKNA